MLFFAKYKAKIMMAGLLVIMLGIGWYVYSDMQATIERQAGEIVAKDIDIKGKELIINQKDKDIKIQADITRRINSKFQSARDKVSTLQNKFDKLGNSSKITRDLGKLAIAKPKLIQRVINSGTKDALRCIEIISGAELTADEKAATKKSQINEACPEIANPHYIRY